MAKRLILTLIFIPFHSFAMATDAGPGLASDRAGLLAFAAAASDPGNALADWGHTNSGICNWTGISCHRTKHRVVQLDLSGRGLAGVISPALSNLSFLAVLDLSSNNFGGEVPRELGMLSRLKQLSLAANRLHGPIPAELGLLKGLVYIHLGGNKLAGPIPETFFCNCTALKYFDLSNNSLLGEIVARDQCSLTELRYLLLWSNNFDGPVPPSLSNSSKLEWVDLESNYLTGELPSEIFSKMPHLQSLHLSYNNLSGFGAAETDLRPFFTSLMNCSHLQELELAGNGLRGEIPPSIGDLSISLLQLHLEDNLLYGPIPATISNLVNLTYLNMSNNFLNESIPPDISRLSRLEVFYLSNNLLSGEIPSSLGEVHHLGLLDVSGNMISGTIPDALSNLSQLRMLMLHGNRLSGAIPPSLGHCVNLDILDLSFNRLSGRIPGEVAGLTTLKLYLNLSHNFLTGPLPAELGKMDMIKALDLSHNNFSGPIPPQLGGCIALEYLNLSSNSLQGPLPSSVGLLPYLKSLDLSSNGLSGALPRSLQDSASLKQLNLSLNNFSGVTPGEGVFASLSEDSFNGNPGLCGPIVGMPSCTIRRARHRVIIPILISLIGSTACCIVCFVGYPLVVKSRRRARASVGDDEEKSSKDYPRISYRELEEATGGFSDSSVIGAGRFGRVYKGTLPNEATIAVKVLNLRTGGGEISGSFRRECEVLKRTRHRNLIRIITTCSKPDFKALVLPLMPNGNLDSHLYPPDGSSCGLSLVQLVNIAGDIAEGLAYLHDFAPVKVVHCDLKPSNVLLDEDMTAVLSDFGIARLVKGGAGDVGDSSSCISTTGLLHGSVGYIAPEYGLGGRPSTQGDVYSFGVLILEIVTGKRPTDVVFHEGLTLQEWVKSQYPCNIEPLISLSDDSLHYKKLRQDVAAEMIELGLVCTHFAPAMRPTMVDVAHQMALLKLNLLKHVFEPITVV